MEENRTPKPLHAWAAIVISGYDDVVGLIAAPKSLTALALWHCNPAVVTAIAWIFTPGVCGLAGATLQTRERAYAAIRPIVNDPQCPDADRASTITLPLQMLAATASEQAGKGRLANYQSAAGGAG